MLIHTEPYRCVISREGVQASQPLSNPSDVCKQLKEPPASLFSSWFVVLFLYLPLNLALICVIAGTLGTFGSIANLHADGSNNSPRDYSNPYMSGLLRGFFVYLFLISGLFLFDDDPFSNPSPNQYIRLAGFLSLFSFIVNYQPNTFSTLIDWAHARIHEKGRNTKAETTESNEASFEAVKHSKTNKDGSKVERTEIKATAKGESESNLEEKTSDTGDEQKSLSK
jgi:hypothetical protein